VSTKNSEKRGIIKVTLVRSTIGRPKNQEVTVRGLGLRKLNSSVELPDTESVRGMVTKVQHLLNVEYVEG
jgi:large subunit ribosomal protein L30